MPQNLVDEMDMPVPRLELRWSDVSDDDEPKWTVGRCVYQLVIGLSVDDVRRGSEDDDDVHADTLPIVISATDCTLGHHPADDRGGAIAMPYRDAEHAQRDSVQLRLPVFVVCDGLAMKASA